MRIDVERNSDEIQFRFSEIAHDDAWPEFATLFFQFASIDLSDDGACVIACCVADGYAGISYSVHGVTGSYNFLRWYSTCQSRKLANIPVDPAKRDIDYAFDRSQEADAELQIVCDYKQARNRPRHSLVLSNLALFSRIGSKQVRVIETVITAHLTGLNRDLADPGLTYVFG